MNASPRRKELTRLAAQLFVQEGFDRTTVRMLAQEMGIKSGSLFHHFKDKQEILAAVIEEGTQNALGIAKPRCNLAPTVQKLGCMPWQGRTWKRCLQIVMLTWWRCLNGDG
ncbi:hypothetical protein HAALTHF_44480n [Vreelandella aquamarina]|nr:hypothetical protein HAALTHF_44480n [Halomonas axialensis]